MHVKNHFIHLYLINDISYTVLCLNPPPKKKTTDTSCKNFLGENVSVKNYLRMGTKIVPKWEQGKAGMKYTQQYPTKETRLKRIQGRDETDTRVPY